MSTKKPSFSSSSTSINPSKHPEMSIRRPSQTNYVDALRASSSSSTNAHSPTVDLPDGRRNSQGEALKSPVSTWTPSFERTQSWNQQDLKRENQMKGWREGEAGFSEK